MVKGFLSGTFEGCLRGDRGVLRIFFASTGIGVFQGKYRGYTIYFRSVRGLFQYFSISVLGYCMGVTGFTGMSQKFYRWVTVRGVLRDVREVKQWPYRVLLSVLF